MDKQLFRTMETNRNEMKQNQEQVVLAKLGYLFEKMNKQTEDIVTNKIKDMIRKINKKQLIIAFTGHFSAGKSTMVNELIGENVLPTSPIPTSANLVCIQYGENDGYLYTNQNEVYKLKDSKNLTKIQDYCKNGEDIVKIELFYPAEELQPDVIYMDTPGIDSVDDAHKLSTESGLHLADTIFYVMDYNHVQSEQNFAFTKALVDKGKKVVAVINQIDKHDDSELSFETYKRQTEAAFQNWGVQISEYYYTSIKNKDLPENELDALKKRIKSIIEHKDQLMLQTALESADQIIREHYQGLKEQLENKLKIEMTDETEKNYQNELNRIKNKKEQELNKITQIEDMLKNELTKLIKNAAIVPYEIRELAKQFLASIQDGFKIGLFFSYKKTEEEKKLRLQKLLEAIKDKVNAQLEWHIKDFLLRNARNLNIRTEMVEQLIYEKAPKLSNEHIIQLVQPGATFNNNYVLQYANDLDALVKQLYRKYASHIIEEIIQGAKDKADGELEVLNQDEKSIESILQEIRKFKNKLKKFDEDLNSILKILKEPIDQKFISKYANKAIEETNFTLKTNTILTKSSIEDSENSDVIVKPKQEEQQNMHSLSNGSLENIKEGMKLISSLTGFDSTVKALQAKIKKLENQQFTVALFGAFSAGKSSFANALMGEYILPVSPNPTTAAINQIKPISEENPHGTVRILFKTKEMLFDEVQASLELIGFKVSDFQEAINAIQSINEEKILTKYHVHLSFLQAVKNGLSDIEQLLGLDKKVDLDSFKEYVADEKKACFVQKIELYYDCDVTKKGVSLVDTPGADSIHARHTNVAFDYIKNADAIIFITYYNHAFSRADREFLIQLGRVKDSFALDKMFFVVNAIDLANSDDEIEQVIQYVKGNLVEYGIRNPRMYPISSKKALNEIKQKVDTKKEINFLSFQTDFLSFMNEDLKQIVRIGAYEILQQSLDVLAAWEEQGRKSKEEQQLELSRLEAKQIEFSKIIKEKQIGAETNALSQEIKELMYYVIDRLRLRFYDLYSEAFSPGSFSNEQLSDKEIIKECLNELLDLVRYNFVQELRATGLRVENFIKKEIKEFCKVLIFQIKEREEHFSIAMPELDQVPSLVFQDINYPFQTEKFSGTLHHFKNTKQFFEKGGRTMVRDELLKLILAYLKELEEICYKEINLFYQDVLDKQLAHTKEYVISGLKDYYYGLTEALSGKIDLDVLRNIRIELAEVLQNKE